MKKIKYIVLVVIVFGVLSVTLYNVTVSTEQVVATNSTPITSHVVVIDAGHGKPDERSCLLTLKITLIFYKK